MLHRTLILVLGVVVSAFAAPPPPGLLQTQSMESIEPKSAGCITCHTATDEPTMHPSGTVPLGCIDCHGGNVDAAAAPDMLSGTPAYDEVKRRAHVAPRHPEQWPSSANPERSYTALNRESPEFIRFMNPGDLRVADISCGTPGCHPSEVARVRNSMMTHGAMLWGAALYNNGGFPLKTAQFGESYSPDGVPQRLQTIPQPTADERRRGVLGFLDPLPRFEVAQPGNILRVFERGDDRLSFRGLGTINRTDPVFQGLQRTRLLDPLLSFLGTNDHPGDYRSSGCTACHVVYANDRDPFHSGSYAQYGNLGTTATDDPTIPRNERGHPIRHVFTRGVPSSQCVVCHVHPGTSFANAYLGYTWWDNETHGEHLFPRVQQHPTPEQELDSLSRNPEATAVRGLWSDLYPDQPNQLGVVAGPDFLERTSELNPQLHLTKLADFHGHGWLFRAVFKHDRKGNLLDARGAIVPEVTPENTQEALTTPVAGRPHHGDGVPVHLKDIHLERGMHCVDCHFEQDMHGDGRLYGEVRNAVEIECVDCHGSVRGRATLRTSGPAAPPGGTDLAVKVTPSGRPLFELDGDRVLQHSMVDPTRSWEVVQVVDTITPGNRHFSELARLAKTIRRDGTTWGAVPANAPDVRAGREDAPIWGTPAPTPTGHPSDTLAHRDDDMACYTCHTAWMTSCFGCHLPMKANARRPALHNEGDFTRNWTAYNYQVLRDDVFMLGRDASAKRNRIVPVRSSSAVLVGSQNLNREWLYSQQQTVSSEGFAGQAFNPHYPHAVRGSDGTKACVDCHPAERGDNNAWMAQVLLYGTNFVNFLGRYVWVAEEDHGLEAVIVTEAEEPQAVIGSHLHALAYPDRYREHVARGSILRGSLMYEHPGNDILSLPWAEERVQSVQLRGEYLYSANGAGGLRVYDVADIDNKKNAERITTSVISPLGQRLYLRTPDAAAVVSPTTVAVDPTRARVDENQEQCIHPLYGFLYVLDREQGLILTGAATLLDGDPNNNFLERAVLSDGSTAWNPSGLLNGSSNGAIAGHYLYVCTPRGLVVVDIDEPLNPRLVAELGAPALHDARTVAVQFRYAFVADAGGLQVVDILDPSQPRLVASVPIADARDVYVARTYAYVAGGAQGLVIVDVERPEHPAIDQVYDADGTINDTRAVKVGMTNASLFAYLADGKNGLRVVQLMSPETPGYTGFSPRPRPDLPGHGLIATYPTRGPAVALSKGLDRDRAVDEAGNQIAVFGRVGARPFTSEEQRRLFMRGDRPYTVPDVRNDSDVRRQYGPPTSR
ncbi:MAG TPA: hypothetical protein VGR62_25015 [Candidatus Binatia bacterium]|jgi:hypothetical protein|nr:hypothetical protein [Candidatus Binatia bacterium]